ncbi:MAG: 5'/3'-nucleotidase SurE [Pirellulales bacterium]|nr:5'/3'-nucleotidase SurE [Pirellulales bacterium]
MALQILLTNDDGIYAPGLLALERALQPLGDICLCAPATEQSGVGHSITFLTPLTAKEVFDGPRRRGWAVDGSPADCVKLGVYEFSPRRPDLVVSGINGGLNAGINVLYSGTVAAAIEGAFYGITSIAVSLEYDEHAQFDRAAAVAVRLIKNILDQKPATPELFNINLPTAALTDYRGVRVVPMGVQRYGETFEKRFDPKGRPYFWAANETAPPPATHETDITALAAGYVTVTPLHFELTKSAMCDVMRDWQWA